jgi:hypothetical protein
MDGKDCLRRLRELLDEESTATWLDTQTSYDFLWEAATEFVKRTECLTKEQRIATVADQPNYVLNADFLKLYLKDANNRHYIIFNNASQDTFIYYRDYEDIVYANNTDVVDLNQTTGFSSSGTNYILTDTGQDFDDWDTTAGNAAYRVYIYDNDERLSDAFLGESTAADTVKLFTERAVTGTAGFISGGSTGTHVRYEIRRVSTQETPDYFSLRDKQDLYSQVTGTITTASTSSVGEAIDLTDTAGMFTTTDYVSSGDVVHNVTDGSDGVVLEVKKEEDGKKLSTILFGGTNNDYSDTSGSAGDSYIIQPQGRFEIYLDPPPSTSNHLIKIPYIARPDPVYSDYGTYKFGHDAMVAIIKYAAWLYKYRDEEPDFGDHLYVHWNRAVTQEARNRNPFLYKKKWTVNLKARK